MTSIRFQLVAATVAMSLLMALLFLPFARGRIESSFHTFEAGYADQELRRLELLLEERAALFSRTALDYSRWNQTVEYIAGSRPEWIEENLTEDVFKNFNVSMIVVADRQFRVHAVRTDAAGVLASKAATIVRNGGTCTAAMARRRPLHRFEMHLGSPHVIVCSPVSAPEPGSPVVGVLVWAVNLSGAHVDDIARLTQFPFTLHPAPAGASRVVHFEPGHIAAQTPVRDWDGRVGLRADVHLPRPLGAQRELATQVMLMLLAAALVAPPMLMLVLLELYVVRRIKRISLWVRAVRLGDSGSLERRQLEAPRSRAGFAELEMLTHDFADLTRRLEVSRAGWRDEALRDSLTGLGSRSSLLTDLASALDGAEERVALLMIDLDGFKAVNDLLGHPIGDVLLQEVAHELQRLVPVGAKAYRLGGDEFAVVWSETPPASPEGFAKLLCDGLRVVRNAGGKPLSVTASIGVGVAEPDTGLSVSELLTHADVALYEAKHGGRATYRMFSSQAYANHRAHLELEAGLRLALAEARLTAWFQPIVSAQDGALLAVEAIARWHEPDRGWIPQTRFIGVAERTGQIADVDTAVIACALRCFEPMRALHPTLRLHLNVSAQSLAKPGFVARLDAALDSNGVARKAVSIELAESGLGIGHDPLERALSHLRGGGMALLVDEFGMGASSLARLARIRPEAVKIDGSFVRDIDGDGGRVCRAIVALARELGVQSFAEYVERDDHAQALTAMGCDALQGRAVSPPLPSDALLAWLGEREQPDAV